MSPTSLSPAALLLSAPQAKGVTQPVCTPNPSSNSTQHHEAKMPLKEDHEE